MSKQNESKIETPTKLDIPTFLMNFPFTVDNRCPNNILMHEHAEKYDYDQAFEQFIDLYKYVTNEALIYLLPSEGNYQDQTYVANLGCYLPHIKDRDIILLSNYKSEPRIGEDFVGRKFFESMKYEVFQTPFHWEGEADLKYIRDNIYIGGHGIRTNRRVHEWMESNFNMQIVSMEMTDPKLYHLDCMTFLLNENKALVATKNFSRRDLTILEQYVEIVEVPERFVYDGWTNCVRINDKILHAPARTKDSEKEFKKLIRKQGYEPVIFYLWEFEKSGADLSCMIMALNYVKKL